jgi:hypothetical protein
MPRQGPRTIAERLGDQRRKAARDASRTIVAITARPEDDGLIDHIAIDLALRGFAAYARTLRRGELVEAVAEGTRRELGAPELADLLLLHEREVQRLRAERRAPEAVPA